MLHIKKFTILLIFMLLTTIFLLTFSYLKTSTKRITTLTLWHNYGGQMKNTMDEMIDEFNETVGAEQGIIINVTSISGSSSLHEKLTMAANDDPGAPALPDITTAYPKTAIILAEQGLLADLNQQFTSKELSSYIPRFIEEGKLDGNALYVFPTAKSTEVLFINMTIFNRFANDTGVTLKDMQSFEGIMNAAALYYEWTDKLTPDIEDDGKLFFMSDSLFNYSMIGCKQLGTNFIKETNIDFQNPQLFKVWESYYKPAVLGHAAIFDGYASDLAKTGDIVCYTGSTAGVLFFSPTVTYADNSTEPADLAILPYPVFEGGEKIAIQRGSGMCVTKSTKEKERLAGIFLKWFTSPKNNLRFISSTGYLPVTEEAFGTIMLQEIETASDDNIKLLLHVVRDMQLQYDFFISPLFEEVDELQKNYQKHLKTFAIETRESLQNNKTNINSLKYEIDTVNKFDEYKKKNFTK